MFETIFRNGTVMAEHLGYIRLVRRTSFAGGSDCKELQSRTPCWRG